MCLLEFLKFKLGRIWCKIVISYVVFAVSVGLFGFVGLWKWIFPFTIVPAMSKVSRNWVQPFTSWHHTLIKKPKQRLSILYNTVQRQLNLFEWGLYSVSCLKILFSLKMTLYLSEKVIFLAMNYAVTEIERTVKNILLACLNLV